MYFKDILASARTGIMVHKSRSALTILGIVIGIASIILVMSIGQSANDLIVGQIESFGPTNVFVLPGKETEAFDGMSTIMTDSLKEKDFRDLQKKENVPDALRVGPFVFGPAKIEYGSEIYNTTVLGSTEGIFTIFDLGIAQGDMFVDSDVTGKNAVVVIGSKVAEQLFGLSDPVGEMVKIKDKKFRVVGVLASKGQGMLDFDKSIIMPYSSAQQYVLGIRYFHRLTVVGSSVEALPGMIRDIQTVLRNNHNINSTDKSKDDFFIQTQEDIVKNVQSIMQILTVLLSSVAAISLVVGGIGIMNIMLVSVTERTREIGLRKALGATNKNILFQFLIEAVILTIAGGLLGILFGTLMNILAVFIATKATGTVFPFAFSIKGMLLGLGVSSFIGFVFGIFPARAASKKNPIESLRYE